MKFKLSHLSVVFALILMAIALFMAIATPFNLFHLKQSERTQLRSVIIVGRHGEVSPTSEAYFLGEELPNELNILIGQDQLTNIGKERMYLLGKFLKLRYYDHLLEGNPRRVSIRSTNSDAALESSQALLAGLNPPKSSNWVWISDNDFARQWQPKAIYTTEASNDDLLSSESACLKQDLYQWAWKNTRSYLQLVNEFRHDLQTLRQNTGLEFEDDLEMLANIEESLRTRASFGGSDGTPAWYTSTLANRLAHVANVVIGTRYKSAEMQQLIVGRLLHEMLENIFDRIRSDLAPNGDDMASRSIETKKSSSHYAMDLNRMQSGDPALQEGYNNHSGGGKQVKLRQVIEPSMFIYMTDKQHLSALLNSLQIYSNEPNYGSLLIIELHFDPINQVHFLRLFTVDSPSHNVLPEPVRVNSMACHDSVECSPQKFEQNIRHLSLRKQAWQQLCQERASKPNFLTTNPTTITTTTLASLMEAYQSSPLPPTDYEGRDQTTEPLNINQESTQQQVIPIQDSETNNSDGTTSDSSVQPDLVPVTSSSNYSLPNKLETLDERLIVGPTHLNNSYNQAPSTYPTISTVVTELPSVHDVPISNGSHVINDIRLDEMDRTNDLKSALNETQNQNQFETNKSSDEQQQATIASKEAIDNQLTTRANDRAESLTTPED